MVIEQLLYVLAELFREDAGVNAVFCPATNTIGYGNEPLRGRPGILSALVHLIVVRQTSYTANEAHRGCG